MSKQRYCNWCEVKIQTLNYSTLQWWGQSQCWIITLWLENTAGCNKAISRACVHVIYRPWAETHESGVTGSVAVTLLTRTTPVHAIAAFLPLRHTHAPAHPRTHTHIHTELGPVLLPQDRSHGTLLWRSAQHDHILTNERGDRAVCMSNDWQHVRLLRGISHA